MIYLLGKLRRLVGKTYLLKAYKTYVRPILEYCSSLFVDSSKKISDMLESCQNRAIRIVFGVFGNFSVTAGRGELGLPTLFERRIRGFTSLCQDVVSGAHVSNMLSDIFNSFRLHNRILRSDRKIIKPLFRTNYGKLTFRNLLLKYLKL